MRTTLSALLLLSLLALGGLAYAERQLAIRSARLDADIAALHRLRWQRLPLRGDALPGNAAPLAHEAVAEVADVPAAVLEELADQLHHAQPLRVDQQTFVRARRTSLGKLIESTQRGWSMTHLPLERGARTPIPNYQRAVVAAVVALADGTLMAPDACLTRCADVIRMGQDLVPGAPLEAASAAARINGIASRVVRGCARLANAGDLQRAAQEFHMLAKQPAPTAHGLIVHDLIQAVSARRALSLPASPSHARLLTALRERPARLAEWDVVDNPHRFRQLSPTDYPAVLAAWRQEAKRRDESGLPSVVEANAGVAGFLLDDMRGQAMLRATAVALAVLAEQAERGRVPDRPDALSDPGLSDPFTGHPLRYRRHGGEVTLWSLGEDLRNGDGDTSWSHGAPHDVVARLTVPTRRTGDGRPYNKRRKR